MRMAAFVIRSMTLGPGRRLVKRPSTARSAKFNVLSSPGTMPDIWAVSASAPEAAAVADVGG